MMKKITIYTLIVAFLFTLFRVLSPDAEIISESYRIPAYVLNGGGLQSSSENFRQIVSLGESTPIGFSQSQYFKNYAGFIPQIAMEGAFRMSLPANWSMISLPLVLENPTSSNLFPEAVVIYGFQKGSGYVRIQEDEALKPGAGYWILLPEAHTFNLIGQTIVEYTTPAEDGWFMIGGCNVRAKPILNVGEIVVIYGYVQDSGYKRIPDFIIDPGKGYWIFFSDTNDQSELRVTTQF
jgi:hypothetical protein